MPSTYDGLASNITFPSALTVTAATNATPIAITTSTPHLLVTGDQVTITGVQGNTAANGANRTVTVTGASTFTINGSAGSGAYTSGGSVQPLTYGGASQIPSDGDPRNAASVNVPLEALFDRTQIVRPALGLYKSSSLTTVTHSDDQGTTAWCTSAILSSGTSGAITSSFLVLQGVAVGDILEVMFVGNTDINNTANNELEISLYAFNGTPGTAIPAFASYTKIVGSGARVTGPLQTFTCKGIVTATVNGYMVIDLGLFVPSRVTSGFTHLSGDAFCIVDQRRPTSVPQ